MAVVGHASKRDNLKQLAAPHSPDPQKHSHRGDSKGNVFCKIAFILSHEIHHCHAGKRGLLTDLNCDVYRPVSKVQYDIFSVFFFFIDFYLYLCIL